MKKLLTLLLALLAVTAANAQFIKGDMNGDGKITMADANEVINTYLGKKAVEYVSSADNSRIQGTWYQTKTKTVSFNANGTTDFTTCSRYGYYPELKAIVFFDSNGALLSFSNILKLTEQEMILKDFGVTTIYTRTKPVYKVASITLSETNVIMSVGGYEHLSATILPEDADDKSYTWKSSDERVATINAEGLVTAVDLGTCNVTCTANDGSGVYATCTVTVSASVEKHEAVDLGLSVKWATCNVGAETSDDYGEYFAWGETTGFVYGDKKNYKWGTYKWCSANSSWNITKYTIPDNDTPGLWYQNGKFVGDNKNTLDPEDDAATANWGSKWRTPTVAEFNELFQNCTYKWVKINDMKGYELTSKKNGNSIFLPACGVVEETYLTSFGSVGAYWTNSLGEYTEEARYLNIDSDSPSLWIYERCRGLQVRPVCE